MGRMCASWCRCSLLLSIWQIMFALIIPLRTESVCMLLTTCILRYILLLNALIDIMLCFYTVVLHVFVEKQKKTRHTCYSAPNSHISSCSLDDLIRFNDVRKQYAELWKSMV